MKNLITTLLIGLASPVFASIHPMMLAQQDTNSAIKINKGENAKFNSWEKDMTGAISKDDFESIDTDLKFIDVDVNKDGYVTPEEMQDAMTQQKN